MVVLEVYAYIFQNRPNKTNFGYTSIESLLEGLSVVIQVNATPKQSLRSDFKCFKKKIPQQKQLERVFTN